MKKIALLLAIVMCVCFLHAGFGFSVGYYFPQDPKSGFIWSLESVRVIDERVDLVFSGDLFTRDYQSGKVIANTPVPGTVDHFTLNSNVSTTYMPFMVGAKIKLVDLDLGNMMLQPFAGGNIGWGMAWESVKFIDANNSRYDDSSFFNGFVAQINVGASLPLGTNSNLYTKLFYNFSDFTKDSDEDNGIVFDELNMSGIGISLGIRMQY